MWGSSGSVIYLNIYLHLRTLEGGREGDDGFVCCQMKLEPRPLLPWLCI